MITLYHHGSSVCAAKVRIVLAEKSLHWEGITSTSCAAINSTRLT